MKYFAVNDNVSLVVLEHKSNVGDFLDFGTRIHASNGVECYGWIDMTIALPYEQADALGLVPA